MGENTGIVKQIVIGTGGLIILTIVVLVIILTLKNANLLGSQSTTTGTIQNETGWINSTGYTLGVVNSTNDDYKLVAIYNKTSGIQYAVGNASVSALGVVTNTSSVSFNNATITYTYQHYYDNNYKRTTDNISNSFGTGIDNVSSKIPTILLIGAVVLLFGVIVLLVRQSQSANIGTSGSSEGSL